MELILCIVCSALSSIITTKILATHYFKIVDGYVDEICNNTKKFVEDVKTTEYKL